MVILQISHNNQKAIKTCTLHWLLLGGIENAKSTKCGRKYKRGRTWFFCILLKGHHGVFHYLFSAEDTFTIELLISVVKGGQ